MSIPEGLEVLQSGGAVIIRWRWRNWISVGVLFFIVFWCYSLFASGRLRPDGPNGIAVPIFIGALVIWVAYTAFGSILNKTDVTITGSRVTSVTTPLPTSLNRDVAAAEIRSLVVRRRPNGRSSVRYAVVYVNAEGAERTLVGVYPREEQANFVAASIRQIMGIGEADSARSKT